MLSILINLVCPDPVMLNTSEYEWNSHDKDQLEYAKVRCPQIWADSPCVIWFKKWEFQDYSVICGEEKK